MAKKAMYKNFWIDMDKRFEVWFMWAKGKKPREQKRHVFDGEVYALGLEAMEKKLREKHG